MKNRARERGGSPSEEEGVWFVIVRVKGKRSDMGDVRRAVRGVAEGKDIRDVVVHDNDETLPPAVAYRAVRDEAVRPFYPDSFAKN